MLTLVSNIEKSGDSNWLKNLQEQAIAENQKIAEKASEPTVEEKTQTKVEVMPIQEAMNNDIMGGILQANVLNFQRRIFKKFSN